MVSEGEGQRSSQEYPEWSDPRLCMDRAANREMPYPHLHGSDDELLDSVVVQGPVRHQEGQAGAPEDDSDGSLGMLSTIFVSIFFFKFNG